MERVRRVRGECGARGFNYVGVMEGQEETELVVSCEKKAFMVLTRV